MIVTICQGFCFLTKGKETIYFGTENGRPVIGKHSPICSKAAIPALVGYDKQLYAQKLDINGDVVNVEVDPEKIFNLLNELLKSV